ncbi:MAG: hypothetical protein JO001_26695 [Alphaproteobacteria bacterium]|nr:hypothetical protein [Alphaproteobacteria bacterium]
MSAPINTPAAASEQAATQTVARERGWFFSFVVAPFKDVDQRATDEHLNRFKRR